MAKPHSASWRASLKLFELFGHPIRFVIFQRLSRQPMSAGELAKSLPVTRPAVVQHLGLLREAGLSRDAARARAAPALAGDPSAQQPGGVMKF